MESGTRRSVVGRILSVLLVFALAAATGRAIVPEVVPSARAAEESRSRGPVAAPGEAPDEASAKADATTGRDPSPPSAPEEGGEGGERAAPPRRPPDRSLRDYDATCGRSGCHAGHLDRTRVHGPAGVGSCAACHRATGDAERHEFELTRPRRELCVFCHEAKSEKKHVHQAYTDGDCLSCHDPHGGPTRAFLRPVRDANLCAPCHDPTRERGEDGEPGPLLDHVHGPITKGSCFECHRAHDADHAGLLIREEQELCVECHRDVAERMMSTENLSAPKSEETCRTCHVAHASHTRGLLRERSEDLCLSCHESIARTIEERAGFHGATVREDYCLVCHQPHHGGSRALLYAPVGEACFTCHGQKLDLASGRHLRNIREEIETSRYQHGAGLKGQCRACHRSHSSPHPVLLTESLPTPIYARYSEREYTFCFVCHDRRLVAEEETVQTRFRDGTRNLHHVHVHREKGRTCRLCHETHGASLPHLMRRDVPFGPGGWRLPIGYEPTETGGSCTSGCHKPMAYDNSTPPAPPDFELAPGAEIEASPDDAEPGEPRTS